MRGTVVKRLRKQVATTGVPIRSRGFRVIKQAYNAIPRPKRRHFYAAKLAMVLQAKDAAQIWARMTPEQQAEVIKKAQEE